jgi:tRNA pseudouridine38-40 synthase
MPTRRLKLTIAYDGTAYAGWQIQPSEPTIQAALEAAWQQITREDVRLMAAGRTDAGVHALGQVASFELPRDESPGSLQRALNGLLPEDLRVLEVEKAPPGFHPRRSARSKLYRYEVDFGGIPVPQRRRYAWHVPAPLEAGAVREVAALYRGSHDFASLASSGSAVKGTVREVTRSSVSIQERTLVYEVEANGFLRKMVRSMVGGLVAAGRGAVLPGELARALEARDRRAWPAPAPARGLTLVRVFYPSSSAPMLG